MTSHIIFLCSAGWVYLLFYSLTKKEMIQKYFFCAVFFRITSIFCAVLFCNTQLFTSNEPLLLSIPATAQHTGATYMLLYRFDFYFTFFTPCKPVMHFVQNHMPKRPHNADKLVYILLFPLFFYLTVQHQTHHRHTKAW